MSEPFTESHHYAATRAIATDVECADPGFEQNLEEVAVAKITDSLTTAQRMEMIMRKSMNWVVPGLALAAAVCASTAAILSKAAAAGDAAAGEHVFARCVACHSAKAGESKIGPSLAGVFGRKSGTAPGYNYSPALKAAGITWDDQELDKYLANPPADIHGTKMVIGVPNAEDRQNVIAYLKTLK
jgi:cytochrome c